METTSYLNLILALAFVIGLILAAGWVARRLGFATIAAGRRGRRRLGIVEVLPLDNRSRLVLVRRDQCEHLLLIGGGDAAVVERGLPAPAESDGKA